MLPVNLNAYAFEVASNKWKLIYKFATQNFLVFTTKINFWQAKLLRITFSIFILRSIHFTLLRSPLRVVA